MNSAVVDETQASYVTPAELRVGLYVHLDLSWMQHPFPTASFKIKDASQITRIRALNLARIRIAPELSDPEGAVGSVEAAPALPSPVAAVAPAAPVAHFPVPSRTAEHLAARSSCERELSAAVREVKSISRSFHAQPEQAGAIAGALIDGLADSMLAEADMAIHLMAEKVGGESAYHHALNVSLLSMLLARQMKAPPQAIRFIGMGALLHDIGKFDIPERIWRKTEPLTRAEQNWVQQHSTAGVEIARRMKMPPEVIMVIAQHHELPDGTGYPKKLKGDQISLLARIVAIANAYDNLCNPANRGGGMTPYEALATLFGVRRKEFDEAAMGAFVRCMGIYPPGTLVGLSDGSMGIVLSVHCGQPLKPTVMLYQPGVPKSEASIVDLVSATHLSVAKAFRPEDLGVEAFDYLAPRARTTYFFQAQAARREH